MLINKTKTRTVISLLIVVFMALSAMTGCGNTNAENGDKKENAKRSSISQLSDVNESDWFYDDVKSVYEKGLMNGTDAQTFSPYEATTRAMIVTILWRLEGEPSAKKNSFSDVKKDSWYTNAVSWASRNDIVNGYSKKSFGPDDVATREQFAAIIYRYASLKNYDMNNDVDIDKYSDAGQISEYAVEAMKWANSKGIITGTSETTLSPKDNVERCQVAAILRRLCDLNPTSDSNKEVPSKDDHGLVEEGIPSNGDDGYDAGETTSNDGEGQTAEGTPSKGNDVSAAGGTSSNNSDISDSVNDQGNGTGQNAGTGEEKNIENNGGNAFSDNNTPSDNSKENGKDSEEDTTNPTIVVDNVSAKPGENVSVKIDIKNNPGILGMVLNAYFDDSSCVLKSIDNGDAVKDILTLTPSKSLENGVRFVWDGVEISSGEVKDGTVLVMQYHISEKAKAGRYPITIKSFDGDIVDNNLNSLPVQIKSGSITVK